MTLLELVHGPLCSALSTADRALLLEASIEDVDEERSIEIKTLEEALEEAQSDSCATEAKALRDQLDKLCKLFETALKNNNVETVGLLIVASPEMIDAHKQLDAEVKRARHTVKLFDDGELA